MPERRAKWPATKGIEHWAEGPWFALPRATPWGPGDRDTFTGPKGQPLSVFRGEPLARWADTNP